MVLGMYVCTYLCTHIHPVSWLADCRCCGARPLAPFQRTPNFPNQRRFGRRPGHSRPVTKGTFAQSKGRASFMGRRESGLAPLNMLSRSGHGRRNQKTGSYIGPPQTGYKYIPCPSSRAPSRRAELPLLLAGDAGSGTSVAGSVPDAAPPVQRHVLFQGWVRSC